MSYFSILVPCFSEILQSTAHHLDGFQFVIYFLFLFDRALFPCGDEMVCIIDDREDVWNFAPNLIHVKPYHFFQHTGDINAPPGLSKQENDDKGEYDFNCLGNFLKLSLNTFSISLIGVCLLPCSFYLLQVMARETGIFFARISTVWNPRKMQ